MKFVKRTLFIAFILTAMCFTVAAFPARNPPLCQAAAFDAFNLLSEEYLEFYEQCIAKEKVYSHYSDARLQTLSTFYGVTPLKLKKVLCFRHAMASIGDEYSIQDILDMDSAALMVAGKKYYDYLRTKDGDEGWQQIQEDFKIFMKSRAHSAADS